MLGVASEELAHFAKWKAQPAVTVSLDVPAPNDVKFMAKNVIAILRGSDPVLLKTAVLLTAHYDRHRHH